MKRFFFFALAYLALAVAILFIFRDAPGTQVWDGMRRISKTMISLAYYLPYMLGGLIVAMLAGVRFINRTTLKELGWALAGSLIFATAFVFVKTSIPYVVPFYADPFFAELDKAMHGGVDPWVAAHKLAPFLNPQIVNALYISVWGLPAAFFMLILAGCDPDPVRRNRFTVLYVFVWIGLGNVLAFAGSSVGPIYYDRLLGTDRFPELLAALSDSGISATQLGEIQAGLWHIYTRYDQMIGGGISAFPSVHNGMATVVMLYMWERSRWLAPLGAVFCTAILFCSVYVGWHYALDGYVSIILVAGLWWGLRRRNARTTATTRKDSAVLLA